MVIKAALKGETIVERPASLSPDLRDRPPHLRPWRDGWRHLRYLFMLSPFWLFAIPAMTAAAAGIAILAIATAHSLLRPDVPFFFGNHWSVLASALVGVSQVAAVLGLATHLYGLRAGYRQPNRWIVGLSRWISLETMIAAGLLAIMAGLVILAFVAFRWTAQHFDTHDTVVFSVVGTLFLTLGAQNIRGGFLLAIVSGNEAKSPGYGRRVPGGRRRWSLGERKRRLLVDLCAFSARPRPAFGLSEVRSEAPDRHALFREPPRGRGNCRRPDSARIARAGRRSPLARFGDKFAARSRVERTVIGYLRGD